MIVNSLTFLLTVFASLLNLIACLHGLHFILSAHIRDISYRAADCFCPAGWECIDHNASVVRKIFHANISNTQQDGVMVGMRSQR